MKMFLTTAISYTNGPPHIGHAYEIVVADIISRFNKLFGRKVHFLTGTDEHDQKIMKTAQSLGITPLDLCDQNVTLFKNLYKNLSIHYNDFIRTTEHRHHSTAQTIFQKCFENDDIYLGEYSGWYNAREERFMTEMEAGQGDYKDTVTGKELEKVSEPSYFFKMEKYRDPVKEYVKSQGFPDILNRLEEPLQDLSISRTSFDWGVPVPCDEKHVMYVWFDALTNYISGSDGHWPPVHLIGRDIVWFHAVIWPCMLLSCGKELPKKILVHGMITDEKGQKMSKSVGNVVDPFDLLTKYSSDQLRYYLIRAGSFGDDIKFSTPNLEKTSDTELANLYGNLVSRSFSLLEKQYESVIPNVSHKFDGCKIMKQVELLISEFELDEALRVIVALLHETNDWLYKVEPWKKKDDKVMAELFDRLTLATFLLSPFIPEATEIVSRRFVSDKVDTSKVILFKKFATKY